MCADLAYALVLLDNGPKKPLTYSIPPEFIGQVEKGVRVKVCVKGTTREGTVFALTSHSPYATKPITHLLTQTLPADLLKLAEFLASYTLTPLSTVLRAFLPSTVRKETSPKTQLAVARAKSREELIEMTKALRQKSPAQSRVLDALLPITKEILLTELCEKAQCSRQTVQALQTKGLVTLKAIPIERSPLTDAEYLPTRPKKLNVEQGKALDAISTALNQNTYATFLMHGVTGSGKTEVYLQAIEQALAQNKGCIVLVPEIALTAQTVERFRSRFEGKIALLHHRLSDGEKSDEWRRLREGKATIAIGPRSAIFSPVQNLGLIIVDEEHESSYKQTESAPLYHARDLAVMRGHHEKACVVLGSATPSLESMYNAKRGKYTLLTLEKRADNAYLPTLQIVDMNDALSKGKNPLLSPTLLEEMEKRFALGEQTLLFLNRRGYHSLQWCPQCKEVQKCPHCSLSLTYHRKENALACHLCDYRLSPPPKTCTTCGNMTLSFKGAGTEQVERTLHALFPDMRTMRIDADTTRHKGSHDRLFRQFRSGKADVLIGTQMIAKGLHFPQVTLVGILNSDISLQIPDFRASETVFQLITQVSGRAGRGTLPGKVLIQTWMPDNKTIQLAAKGDYEAFYNAELANRKLFGFPPYTRLIKLTFSGVDQENVQKEADKIHSRLSSLCEALPVSEAGYAKVKGNYRFQFLMRASHSTPLREALLSLNYQPPKGVRLHIDVDPLSTYF